MEIRPIQNDDLQAVLQLRSLLWPDETLEEHERELQELIANETRSAVFVASTDRGEVVGFVDAGLRDWAEGCRTRPVGYIEGWYVLPEHRKMGVGRRLIEAAENWARSRGCSEIGSDLLLGNEISELAHRALGYTEVRRLVLFRKKLTH